MSSSSSIASFIKEFYPEYWGDQTYPISSSVFFRKKIDAHWILSNMAATPLVVEGVQFNSSEHLFQTMKFCTEDSINAVYCSHSPKMTAKHYQKLGGHRREDWGNIHSDVMKSWLRMKSER